MTSGIKELGGAALIVLAPRCSSAHRPGGGLRAGRPARRRARRRGQRLQRRRDPVDRDVRAAALRRRARARPRRTACRRVGMWVLDGVLAVVLGLPAVVSGVTIAQIATAGGPEGLGNLAAPSPCGPRPAPWLTPDYRFPLADGGAAGPDDHRRSCWCSSWPRRHRVVRAPAADSATWRSASPGWSRSPTSSRASATWSDFKAITVTAPFDPHLGFAGAAALGMWRRAVGVALGGLVAVGVLAGNFLFFHGTSFAPYDRLARPRGDRGQVRRPGPVAVPGVRGVQPSTSCATWTSAALEPGELRSRAGTRRRCRACSSSATRTSTARTT